MGTVAATPVEGPDWAALRARVLSVDPILVAVVGLALVARFLYWRVEIPGYSPNSDAAAYYWIGRNVAEGHGFADTFPQLYLHPTAFRPPLFPLLLAGVFWLFGASVGLAQGVNLLLGLGVVALTMVLARDLGLGRPGEIAAGVAVALYPPLIYNDVVVLTEPLSVLLLLLAVILLQRRRPGWAALALGLLVLSRTSAQLILPVFVVWVLWQHGWRTALRFALVAVIVLAPWSVRNRLQVGTWSLATSNGFNLAAEYGRPALDAEEFKDPAFDPYYDQYRTLQFDEARWDRELFKVGLRSIKEDPSVLLGVAGRNARAYFELDTTRNYWAEKLDGRNMRFRDRFTWLVLPFGVIGTIGLLTLLRRPVGALLLVTGTYFVASSLFLIAAPRLRAPVEVLWCVGFGAVVGAGTELVANLATRRAEP